MSIASSAPDVMTGSLPTRVVIVASVAMDIGLGPDGGGGGGGGGGGDGAVAATVIGMA